VGAQNVTSSLHCDASLLSLGGVFLDVAPAVHHGGSDLQTSWTALGVVLFFLLTRCVCCFVFPFISVFLRLVVDVADVFLFFFISSSVPSRPDLFVARLLVMHFFFDFRLLLLPLSLAVRLLFSHFS
jgi:hypothetical protein